MECYIIPHQDQFIIYRPLLRTAFIANAAMVNLISQIQDSGFKAVSATENEAAAFLDHIGFFESEKPFDESGKNNPDTFSPATVILFLTNACNFKCIYCYASAGEPHRSVQRMDPDIGRAAIDQACMNAQKMGQDHFLLGFHGGGEPTLAWQQLTTLVEYARQQELPCQVQLTTNGFWSRTQREWAISHIDEISLSFDGMPSLQNRQRPLADGRGSYTAVMETIQELDRLERPYGIRVTVTEDGMDQLAENITFLCANTHCNTFQVEPAFKQGRALVSQTAVKKNNAFARAFLHAWEIADAHDRHIYYSGARPWLITDQFCQAPESALIVGPDGFLTACYEICSKDHELAPQFFQGDLMSDGTMTLLYDQRQELLEKIAQRRESCRDCFCFWHCAGDCPSKTMSAGREGHLEYKARCDLNREITKGLILRYIEKGDGLWQEDRLIAPGAMSCEPTGENNK